MLRALVFFVIFSFLALADPLALVREAEALYPERYQLAVLERMISLYEQALAEDPGNKEFLVRLAQLWYEWGCSSLKAKRK